MEANTRGFRGIDGYSMKVKPVNYAKSTGILPNGIPVNSAKSFGCHGETRHIREIDGYSMSWNTRHFREIDGDSKLEYPSISRK